MLSKDTDVIVMGAGLAGITAAIWAARTGAKVCIVSSSKIGSGSSFYPGTWGLGLIGPESKEDEEDLLRIILKIGEGMVNPELARTLVKGIHEGISDLKAMGLPLMEPVNKDEKAYIPCFDYKNREWHGIVKDGARQVFYKELEKLGVDLLENTSLTDIIVKDKKVVGARAVHTHKGSYDIIDIRCSSIVIASGGLGGLFSHRLNTSDIRGLGQFLAYEAGDSLINLEFMQMMIGYLKPAPKTIYNEKVFKYSDFTSIETGKSVFEGIDKQKLKDMMEVRSTYGPFTCRLGCEDIDVRIYEEGKKSDLGVLLTYKDEIRDDQPEFVRTYFEWLEEDKGLTINDPVKVAMFAHASNGGIQIDTKGATSVKGLYACGEATGGMHGADRIGGLSTANGLVFGKIAGISAAKYSSGVVKEDVGLDSKKLYFVQDASKYINEIRSLNYNAGMVVREEEGIVEALEVLAVIRERANASRKELNLLDLKEYQRTRELEAALTLSEAMLRAMLIRKESRGSHFRRDYPYKNEEFSKPIIISQGKKESKIEFMV